MKQALSDALSQRGYTDLTPVQQAVTDPDLADADLLVSAQTGSGKTVGFGLALGATLLGDDDRFGPAAAPLSLVIAPTRELALQVKRELSWLYAQAGATVTSCVGGMDMRDERRALARGSHIVVATPGRLRDHIMRGSIDLAAIRAVVLDEADEMLDLGFREDLEFILSESPNDRRTLLFSATVPRAIAALAQTYQKDAVRVTTMAEASQHADIEYVAMPVAARDADNAIINILRYFEAPNALVFANTRAMVNRLTTRLSNRGFSVVALSGELSQSERTHALQAMRDGRARVCVATDVAARGIDLPSLDLVIHAELPNSHETLLHRSGRTGRAGRKGVSALVVPDKMRRKAERILKFAKLTARWDAPPSADAVRARDAERMMAEAGWQTPVTESEAAPVAALLDAFDAEQIAAAYLRLYHARQSAPEELSAPGETPQRAPREAFGPSVWYEISGGRDAGAEPRRILPMLCKAGGLSREEIGAIRIRQDRSVAQIREPSAAAFDAALAGKGELEPGVTITRLDSAPDLAGNDRTDGRPSPRAKRADAAAPHRKTAKKPASDAEKRELPAGLTPYKKRAKTKPAKPTGAGPRKPKGPPPPPGKPSSKKNRARAQAAARATGKGGKAGPRRGKP